jgi:hypothetical protein
MRAAVLALLVLLVVSGVRRCLGRPDYRDRRVSCGAGDPTHPTIVPTAD